MRTEQLQYLMAVVQTGSFSKAADVVLIKQQSVREAINSLEEELGMTLFHRSPHGVTLTQEGEACLEDFEEIMKIHRRILDRARQTQKEKLQVKIGVNALVGQQIQGVLDLLCDNIPEYDLQFVGYPLGNDVLQSVIQHECELGITTVTSLIMKRDEYVDAFLKHDIMFKPLKKMRFGVYVKKGHPLSSRRHMDIEELKKWPVSAHTKEIITEYIQVLLQDELTDVMISSAPQMHLYRMERKQGVVVAPEDIDWGNEVEFIPFTNQVSLQFGIFYTRAFTEDRERMELLTRLALLLMEN